MIYRPNPADFWEQQKINDRKFMRLLVLLAFLYILFIYIFIILCVFTFKSLAAPTDIGNLVKNFYILFISITAGIIISILHLNYNRKKVIETILSLIKKSGADKNDLLHKQIVNIIDELKIAAGFHKRIDVIIIQSLNKNIFSLSAGGMRIIGLTEGLINRFSRDELQAMLAQQFSLIITNDAELMTFICSIYSFYAGNKIKLFEDKKKEKKDGFFPVMRGRIGGHGSGGGNAGPAILIIFGLIALLFIIKLFIRILILAISRNREFFADSKSVEFTRNPMALAESLHKISSSRASKNVILDAAYSPLFIVPPENASINEKSGLFADFFSTHPPADDRIEKLLKLGGSDLKHFKKNIKSKKNFKTNFRKDYNIEDSNTGNQQNEDNLFYAYSENQWNGPFTLSELFCLHYVFPDTFINLAGSEEVIPLKKMFPSDNDLDSNNSNNCPRCARLGGRLIDDSYEFAPVKRCTRCRGYLVKGEILLRILNRRLETFSGELLNYAEDYKRFVNSQKKALKTKKIDEAPLLDCPNCNHKMHRTFINYIDYVVVDRCIVCDLIWFDNKELELLQIYHEEREDALNNNLL